jgi:hypothetical protein
VELTAPTTALVLGFPLLMMLVMLLMNTVERWLTSPGRPPLRLVPTGAAGPAAENGDGEPAEPATVPIERLTVREAPLAAAMGADGPTRPIEFHPALQLVNITGPTARVSPADA